MMCSTWFICCEDATYEQLRSVLKRREAQARLLRVDDCAVVVAIAEAGGLFDIGICIELIDAEVDRCESEIQQLAQNAALNIADIVVCVPDADPAYIARLFFAGATEIITKRDLGIRVQPSSDSKAACTEEEQKDTDDQRFDEEPQWATRETPAFAAQTEAPRYRRPGDAPDLNKSLDSCGDLYDSAANGSQVAYGTSCDFDLDEPVAGDAAAHGRAADKYAAAKRAAELEQKTAPARSRQVHKNPQSASADWMQSVNRQVEQAKIPKTTAFGRGMGHRAPLISIVSGQGGAGKTTLVAAMAAASARFGLRCAVIDLDLMFGNAHELFDADRPGDLALLLQSCGKGYLTENEVVETAALVGPNVTLWGPIERPEQAELMAPATEMLVQTLRQEADLILVDTSTFWGDAMASAVSGSDRCVILGSHGVSACGEARRAIELVERIGVPRTRMVGVLNRFGARECGEEFALRFEMACSLASKFRVADGGADISNHLAYGGIFDVMEQDSAFTRDVDALLRSLLCELGCSVDARLPEPADVARSTRSRLRLPWKKEA